MDVVPVEQLAVPVVHAILLSPVLTSWNALLELLFAARAYNMAFTLPSPLEDVAWLRSARTPAKAGAPAEVPPTAEKLLLESRKPLVQSPGPQIK